MLYMEPSWLRAIIGWNCPLCRNMKNEKQETYQKVNEVLGSKGLIMLSTSNRKGQLHVSVMHYVRPTKKVLLMSCDKRSTKIRNIRENPRVGLVKFKSIKKPSLLIYGRAKIIKQDAEVIECREIFKTRQKLKKLLSENRRFIHVDIQKVIFEHYPPGGKSVYFEIEPY